MLGGMAPTKRPIGRKLLAHDRRFGVRYVAGADEAGRGPLAGPLVAAGVLLDMEKLRQHRARPLALLNDSKQVDEATRDVLYRAVMLCAEKISIQVFPAHVIDRDGLHRCNLKGLRDALWALGDADVRLVDGFKLGPLAPPHQAVVDGDTKSAAIAAASIVAKVTRDRYMHFADAWHPGYGFSSHVGYITPLHSAAVRKIGPSAIHRLSFAARCYGEAADEAVAATA
ncbi:MAG: ribonuclease HII [Actinobacteria bacterium]|uniref:Ribonuclease HII n=1 Tax=freshwater metagenome TaxID=449393 RepID=A0A6J6P4E6_9ZZZZ|nr:ribonuclease HII [Actinomycetota bacterium]